MILWILALNFLLLSLVAIGGASAVVPEMHRVLVSSLHLMTETQFQELFALSQAAPGPNVLFVGLFGWQIAGFAGAFVSMLFMCGPTGLIALGAEKYGFRYHDRPWYLTLQRALTPVAIGLLLSTSVLLMRSAADLRRVGLSLFTGLVLMRFRLNPLWLIGFGALLGGLGFL